MTVFEELKRRGLLAQLTDEEEIKELINAGKATFYIGFDPTADSLHVGHFMALCLMKRLQMAGNKPIVLIGGGTAMIGDPSGKTDMRKMMTKETINHNVECFKKQMSHFIDFSDDHFIDVGLILIFYAHVDDISHNERHCKLEAGFDKLKQRTDYAFFFIVFQIPKKLQHFSFSQLNKII